MLIRSLLVMFFALLTAGRVLADDSPQSFSSGPGQVALIETFTSEGCSSCPPADRWVNNLRDDDRLWKNFVPISFHVDYWDYIGWTDRFAKPAHADRQRRYVDQGGARFAYTPGLFLNGEEWVGWRSGEAPLGDRTDVGTLSISVEGDRVAVQFAGDNGMPLAVHVALLGMDLSSDVKAGENKGRKLRHDFVALGVASSALQKTSVGYQTTVQLPPIETDAKRRAIVAWVSTADREAPIQAVGGFL